MLEDRRAKDTLDFLIVGAQKAGTTSLHEYMCRHPQIYMPPGKERPFFSHDSLFERGWVPYLERNFGDASPDQRWGKATPAYMAGAPYERSGPLSASRLPERIVPERIHARLPDARIIAILRDPVDRCESHFKMGKLVGWEKRDFATAMRELLEDDALAASRREPEEANSYITWGEYGRILEPYVEMFGADRVLVLFTGDLATDPAAVLRRTFTFIGVDPDFEPPNLGERYRVAATRQRFARANPYRVQESMAGNGALRRAWHALPRGIRARVSRRFSDFAYRFVLWNRRSDQSATDAPPDPDTVAALRAHYREDARRLAGVIGQDPPWSDERIAATA